jgi:hypothetical protein
MVHHVKFLISSKNNIFSGTNPVKLPLNNIGNDCRIVRIVIKSASIPNVFYNVRDNINNKLFVGDGVENVYLITIPEGQYTLTQLLDYLNAQPAFLNTGANLTFNAQLNKIITNNPTIFNFEYFGIFGPNSPNNKIISGCYELLGLTSGVNYSFPTGANLHPNICDLSGIKNVYVNCSFSKLNAIETKGYRDLGGIVPMDVPFGAVKTYLNQEQALDIIQRDPTYSQNLTDPEITLTDIDGNLLNTNGVNWEMCFKIYHAEGED